MNLKQLLSDDSAVSPVIGVILMVAITVILAAVIGTFVLGLGDQVGNNAPQASFDYNYSATASSTDDSFGISHVGGDTIESSTLDVKVAGVTVYDDGATQAGAGAGSLAFPETWDTKLTAGDKLTVEEGGADVFGPDDEIKIIWQNPSGGSTSVISSGTIS